MKNILYHFLDLLIVTISYLGMIIMPLYIILNILRVCSLNNGFFDLLSIVVAIISFFICRYTTKGARRAHNSGNRFLF